jgi:methionyl-tRNA formyltransferase
MRRVLELLPEVGRMPQDDSKATYAPKIRKEEARLDFGRSAVEVERQVRAFNPAPGAYFEFGGERIKLLAAEVSEEAGTPGQVLDDRLTIGCGTGSIVPRLVQRAGRAAMSPAELLRGFAIPPGAMLA